MPGDPAAGAEPPVEEVSLKITICRERLRVVSYRVMLDVPRELVLFVSGLLAARRREIGTRKGTRRLGSYRQALFALAWFRDKGDIPRLGRGFGLPQSTAYRYLDEVIGVLAARAPGLQQALERALGEGTPYLILDGKVVDADRCREKTTSCKGESIDVWYAGKTHDFGGNIQALFYPSGIPLWVSDVLPGNVHDLAAARQNVLGILRPFLASLPVLADPGYDGAGHGVHVPVKKPAGVRELDINTRTRNALIRSARCLGERGFALLTQRWKTLQHVTASPGKIGLIAKAALVLVLFEHKMIT
jgi:DDE superfamily endonuclease